MRPRVFPAEDESNGYAHKAGLHASMRPRVFPAEDLRDLRRMHGGAYLASMRPRVFPAEDSNRKYSVPRVIKLQ